MMRINLIAAFVFTAFMAMSCAATSPQTSEELEETIRGKLQPVEGTFAVAFQHLADSAEAIYINEREMFHAASTMKTPVMIELFKQAEAGAFSLEDSVEIKNEFRSIVDSSRYRMDIDADSEGELYELIGRQRPVSRLVDDMITMSSNQIGRAHV